MPCCPETFTDRVGLQLCCCKADATVSCCHTYSSTAVCRTADRGGSVARAIGAFKYKRKQHACWEQYSSSPTHARIPILLLYSSSATAVLYLVQQYSSMIAQPFLFGVQRFQKHPHLRKTSAVPPCGGTIHAPTRRRAAKMSTLS